MSIDATAPSARAGRVPVGPGRDWDGVQFRTILLLCVPVHLVAALAARLSPGLPSGSARRSLFAQAWEASSNTARIALSG